MFELLIIATGIVLAASWVLAYSRTRDALHPLIYIVPMMAFQYVVRPWQLYSQGELQRLLPALWILELGAFVHLIGVIGFCWGAFPKAKEINSQPVWRAILTPQARQNIARLAIVLGLISCFFFYYSVFAAGGITKAFGRPKGGGIRLASGYFGEAIGLCVPAVVLLLLAWQRRKLRLGHWTLIGFLASPYLLTGTLGTRRGPAFMILGAMAFAWFLIRTSRPKLVRVVSTVLLICLVVVFVFTNRPRLYIGSEQPIDWSAPWRFLTGKGGASEGDDYVVALANIAVFHSTGKFGWGRDLLITFFVRPIPRQLWPTQYEDARRFLFSEHELVTGQDFLDTVGWVPAGGSAIGGVADLFRQFSWGVFFAMYLYGRFYGFVWCKARKQQGIWVIIYIIAASLSIYIPTQSMSAVFHRFLFLTIPLVLIWKLLIEPRVVERRVSPISRPVIPVFTASHARWAKGQAYN
jgi:hypothetical protein